MTRRQAGEAGVILEGKAYTLKLTLGALADIEEAINAKALSDIDALFKVPSATGIVATLSAMLAAGSHMPLSEAKKLVEAQPPAALADMMDGMSAALETAMGVASSTNPPATTAI